MSAVLVVVVEVLACIGLGAVTLRVLRLELAWGERLAWAFGLGFGWLGWLVFFIGVAGLLSGGALATVLGAGVLGLVALLPRGERRAEGGPPAPAAVDWALLVLLGLVLALQVVEAAAPPADADTLAYHFALPKRFLQAGRIEFVPRAVEGAVPLLVQMTYVPALALGGERGLTLWTMASGWAAAALVFVLCRRHLSARWSLAAALVFLTTPAVVYGAGSGQVEVRNALFVLVAAPAAARALRTRDPRLALVAGLAAGFFAGGKYTGLLFVAAAGATLLAQRRWLALGALFSAGAVLAGGQWYVWNYVHTGDPFFPLLFGVIDYGANPYWNAEVERAFQAAFFTAEKAVPVNLWWFFAYPFVATLGGPAEFESGRVGLGPFALLVLPFALAGAWRFRHRMMRSPLLPMAAMALMFYALWFFTGSSQRIRHLLPVYPLVLVCLLVAAHRWARGAGGGRIVGAAIAATLIVQSAGLGLFSLNYLKHLIAGESRRAFLERNVSGFSVVPWINRTLTDKDRILVVTERQLVYLIDVPVYYAHRSFQAVVPVGAENHDAGLLYRRLRRERVDYLLVAELDQAVAGAGGYLALARRLIDAGCAEEVFRTEATRLASRTLPGLASGTTTLSVLRLKRRGCPFAETVG